MKYRLIRLVLVLILSSFLTGCASIPKATTPIPHRDFHVEPSNSTLVVLLPGRGDALDLFVENGTVEQIRRCNPDANIVGAGAHLGYYTQRTLVEELRQTIVGPALAGNVERVWLMGVSIGGMGSLLYRRGHPSELEGVILMAPYIGEWDELKQYIEDPESVSPSDSPPWRLLWDHLTDTIDEEPSVTLAFGTSDRFVRQQKWMAGHLDKNRVVRSSGGHYWWVWDDLWPRALKASGFCEGL